MVDKSVARFRRKRGGACGVYVRAMLGASRFLWAFCAHSMRKPAFGESGLQVMKLQARAVLLVEVMRCRSLAVRWGSIDPG